ncbi:MAG: hypothetical protein Alpg2KO_21740 [Alphaproteobacteria bacterium]
MTYGLLVGLIGIVALAATQSTGRSVESLFSKTATTLLSGTDAAAASSGSGNPPTAGPSPSPSPMAVFSFSNCGSAGRTGPSLSACTTAYSGTSLDGNIQFDNQDRQIWTVPTSGTYQITAQGAAGGNAVASGGNGAEVSANFTLTGGHEIAIVVGQLGGNSGSTGNSGNSAGGGGGTYVVNATTNTLLIAAGGGGGAGVADTATPSHQAGVDAVWNETDGGNAVDPAISPGQNGNGGAHCTSTGASSGAGWSGNSVAYSGWATAASSYANGSDGSYQPTASGGDGGYGGGGAGAYGGGGGGGYSGGACGSYQILRDSGGGGGGSYIAPSGNSPSGQSGANSGHGSVDIQQIN